MKNINNILQKFGIAMAAFLLVFTATGCDALNNNESEIASPLTEEDLEAASAILAESLSDQNEGLMADLNDMTADIESQRLNYSRRRFADDPMDRPCRGEDRAFESSYDETTGTHSIKYSRSNDTPACTKSVEVNLNYVFTDADGNFMAEPRVNKSEIADIAFEGSRVGGGTYASRRGIMRTTSFEQVGEWNLTGLQSDVAALSGSQVNDGSYSLTKPDSTGQDISKTGEYHIEFKTVDVTISRAATERADLETEISGTIQYTMSMTTTRNGETRTKEAEGTVVLEGNGRALLRFLGLNKVYRLSLHDGEVSDDDASDDDGSDDDNSDDDNTGSNG